MLKLDHPRVAITSIILRSLLCKKIYFNYFDQFSQFWLFPGYGFLSSKLLLLVETVGVDSLRASRCSLRLPRTAHQNPLQ